GSVEAGNRIRQGGAHHAWVFGVDQQTQEATCGLRDRVVGGATGCRASGSEAADRAIDEAGVDLAQALFPHVQPVCGAGPEVLNVDIGIPNQFVEGGKVIRVLRVEGDTALVAVVSLEMRAVQTPLERAERVARAGLLN